MRRMRGAAPGTGAAPARPRLMTHPQLLIANAMGLDNIIAGDGFGIAITGMIIVFAGLLLISLYIASIPKLFEWAGRQAERRKPRAQAADAGRMGQEPMLFEDEALLAAVGYVIRAELEQERARDLQRITIQHDESQRVWTAIGKMRTLSTRI